MSSFSLLLARRDESRKRCFSRERLADEISHLLYILATFLSLSFVYSSCRISLNSIPLVLRRSVRRWVQIYFRRWATDFDRRLTMHPLHTSMDLGIIGAVDVRIE